METPTPLINRLQNVAASIDASDDDFAPPPRIWWRNGSKAAGTGGFFYAKAADHGRLVLPWSKATVYGDEQGYVAERLHIIVLAIRMTPYKETMTPDGRRIREYAPTWQTGMRFHTEILCLPKGGDGTPCVWSATGLTGKAIKGIFDNMRRYVVDVASQMIGRKLSLSAFWTPMQTEQDSEGRVVYTPIGYGAYITRPSLSIRQYANERLIEALLLDEATLMRVTSLRYFITQWKSQTRVPALAGTARTAASEALTMMEEDDEL